MITYTLYFLYIFDMSLSYSFNESNASKIDDVALLPRVYNGVAAKLGQVPYQVSFKMRRSKYNKYASFCGGVIIEPAKLLSAAHCFAEKPKPFEDICGDRGNMNKKMLSHIMAVAGQLTNVARYHKNDSIEQGQWRHLKGVRYPFKYRFPKKDIALVFLMTPFVFNENVAAIPYATKFGDYVGKCLVSGFGRTSPYTSSDKLLLAHLTLLPWKRCNTMHRRNMFKFICTDSQLTDVGKGDSGGPLVCSGTQDPADKGKGVLVGIVSGNARYVGSFFTRVSSYRKFIERNKSCIKKHFCLHLTVLLYILYWRFLLF